MAKPITHQRDEEPHWTDVTYGRCEKSPYVENGLWFVHVPRSSGSVTYFVAEEYARPDIIDQFNQDRSHDPWVDVAQLTLPGSDWNPEAECRWREMPYYVHTLPDGTPIRYGLSRSQSTKFPRRELWYVVIGLGEQERVDWHNHESFVVDQICTKREFMDRMGRDPQRWRAISWEASIGIEPWYARLDDFAPDPFLVFKIDAAEKDRSWLQKLADKVNPGRSWSQTTYQTFMRESDDTESYDPGKLDVYLRAIFQNSRP